MTLKRCFGVLLVGLALSGWGCKAATPALPPSSTGTAVTTPQTLQKPSHIATEADFRNELKAAVKKFTETKSFRAKVTLSINNNHMDAVLEYAKPNRFHGTIQGTDGSPTEIIVVDNSLYMRVNTLKWLNLSRNSAAANIGTTLKNALAGDSNLSGLGVDDSLPVKKSTDTANACDLYQTSVKATNGTSNEVNVCLANGLPKYLDLTTAQGPIHIDYYDYNTVFLIERPTE